jgi:uncharacterized membrane protein
MSNFELFMSFFGLLLGLAVAELMSGFANLARAKDRPKIGLITPILGLLIFLSIMTSLLDAFRKLQDVPISLIGFALPTLIGIAYFVAAIAAVPRDQGSWESLDDYFFERRTWTVGMLLAAAVLTLGIELRFTTQIIRNAEWGRFAEYAAANFVWLAALVVTLTARKRWIVLAAFGLSIALILYYYGEFAVDLFPQTRTRGD